MPGDLGREVAAPAGHYTPLEEHFVNHRGGLVLYVLGRACVESSCCGVGDWEYVRVEGRVERNGLSSYGKAKQELEVGTIDSEDERKEIVRLLLAEHPGARVEFR